MCNERYNGVTRREEPTHPETESEIILPDATEEGDATRSKDDTSLGEEGNRRERPPAELSDGEPS